MIGMLRDGVDYTTPTGIKTRLWGVGVLAERLHRNPQTVRRWEKEGIIPIAPFRDSSSHRNRMYSTEHIDAIVKCFEESGMKNGKSIAETEFSNLVYKEFENLRKLFFGG